MNPEVDHENGKLGKVGRSWPKPIGKAKDLSKLILYPEIVENVLIVSINSGIEASGLETNSNISSAYSAILNLCSFISNPDIFQ